MSSDFFDNAATKWDEEPRRVEMAEAVGEAIRRQVGSLTNMDVLDYGCGTGLLGLFLQPHARSITGADSSPGMLDVLRKKLAAGGVENMKALQLDLEHDPLPRQRYHVVATSMTMHHLADTGRLLRAFHDLLHPGGMLCLADLDTEPGIFHRPQPGRNVHHHGFDRGTLKSLMESIGFRRVRDVTAYVIRKTLDDGREHEFPVFLITAQRSGTPAKRD